MIHRLIRHLVAILLTKKKGKKKKSKRKEIDIVAIGSEIANQLWPCAGNVEECKTFFQTLYKFVFLLGTYLKPHVSMQSLPSFRVLNY